MTQPAPEIKKTVRGLVYRCPLENPVATCPFTMLGLLSYESRESMLRAMSNEDCARLFDLTSPCQCPADPRRTGATCKPDQVPPQ